MPFVIHKAEKLQQWLVETAEIKTADQEQADGGVFSLGEQLPFLMDGSKIRCLATREDNVH